MNYPKPDDTLEGYTKEQMIIMWKGYYEEYINWLSYVEIYHSVEMVKKCINLFLKENKNAKTK